MEFDKLIETTDKIINTLEKITIISKKTLFTLNRLAVKKVDNNKYKSIKILKPFIKWVGGKTQILNILLQNFPTKMNNYHEPFLGGGSVLLALLIFVQNKIIQIDGQIFAYDLNKSLVWVYKNIQSNYQSIYKELSIFISEYNKCNGQDVNRNPISYNEAEKSKENYYYWIRKRYNNMPDEEKITHIGSAIFIFLNKTCFRGLYRIGPYGFNVPFGHYKNIEIDEQHLKIISNLIKDVKFQEKNFIESLKDVKSDDFVYLDPPYAPETNTSFVKYNSCGFSLSDHNKLFQLCNNLPLFMMSNSDVKLVKKKFDKTQYRTQVIVCRRAINSKNPESITNEVIITNY